MCMGMLIHDNTLKYTHICVWDYFYTASISSLPFSFAFTLFPSHSIQIERVVERTSACSYINIINTVQSLPFLVLSFTPAHVSFYIYSFLWLNNTKKYKYVDEHAEYAYAYVRLMYCGVVVFVIAIFISLAYFFFNSLELISARYQNPCHTRYKYTQMRATTATKSNANNTKIKITKEMTTTTATAATTKHHQHHLRCRRQYSLLPSLIFTNQTNPEWIASTVPSRMNALIST